MTIKEIQLVIYAIQAAYVLLDWQPIHLSEGGMGILTPVVNAYLIGYKDAKNDSQEPDL